LKTLCQILYGTSPKKKLPTKPPMLPIVSAPPRMSNPIRFPTADPHAVPIAAWVFGPQ